MDTTLTIRLPKAQRDALKRRAASQGKSESALLRDLIAREMDGHFDFKAVRHLVGSVESNPRHWTRDPRRNRLRERNWRA